MVGRGEVKKFIRGVKGYGNIVAVLGITDAEFPIRTQQRYCNYVFPVARFINHSDAPRRGAGVEIIQV